jgi:plastocyanin
MTIGFCTRRAVRALLGGVAVVAATMLASCGGDASGTDAPVVEFELGRYTISPNDLTITAGPVTLQVTNVDTMAHSLVVAGKGTRVLAPGESQTIPAEIEAGDHRMWCDVPGHAELGQVGVLRVVAPDTTPTSVP